jgi:hypothetical protein
MSVLESLGKAQAKVKTLDGEKIFIFELLNAKDNMRVFHDVVQTLIASIASVADLDGGGVELSRLGDAVQMLSFDKVRNLAKLLLTGMQIKPDMKNLNKIVVIDDIDDCEYFMDCPEELYIAIFHAIRANYPKSFSRLATKMGGFGQRVGTQVAKLSGTASDQQNVASSQ